jgi:hypothetical protein
VEECVADVTPVDSRTPEDHSIAVSVLRLVLAIASSPLDIRGKPETG